jgi:DNA-binding protein H-NS
VAKSVDKMSYAELSDMELRIQRAKAAKQNIERVELRQKVIDLIKSHGFQLSDIIGGGRKSMAKVAIKYRDPANPQNTWTGRGRMPRWMTAATRGGKAKRDDFLVK